MDDIVMKFAMSLPNGPSIYRVSILLEQSVLVPICGMPRVIRAFILH